MLSEDRFCDRFSGHVKNHFSSEEYVSLDNAYHWFDQKLQEWRDRLISGES